MSGHGIQMGSEREKEYMIAKRNALEKSMGYSETSKRIQTPFTKDTADVSRY